MIGQTSGRAGLEAAKYTQKRRLSRPCNDHPSLMGIRRLWCTLGDGYRKQRRVTECPARADVDWPCFAWAVQTVLLSFWKVLEITMYTLAGNPN